MELFSIDKIVKLQVQFSSYIAIYHFRELSFQNTLHVVLIVPCFLVITVNVFRRHGNVMGNMTAVIDQMKLSVKVWQRFSLINYRPFDE